MGLQSTEPGIISRDLGERLLAQLPPVRNFSESDKSALLFPVDFVLKILSYFCINLLLYFSL